MKNHQGVLSLIIVTSVLASAVLGGGALAVSDGGFTVSISENITVPERTYEVEGSNYSVSSVATRYPNETITVDVTSSSDVYNIQLRDAKNEQIMDSKSGSGDETKSFDLEDSGADPGVYFIAISEDGNIQLVYPVVVEAYDVDATVPSDAEEGDTISISATLTEQVNRNISSVEVVIADQDEEISSDLQLSDGAYEGDVSLSELSTGTYNVYVGVRGEEDVQGEKTILGLSDEHEMEISAAETTTTTTTTTTSDGGGGGGAGGGGGGGGETTTTTTATTTTTVTDTTTTADTTTTSTTSTSTTTSTTSPTTTTEDVVTPDNTTTVTTTPEETSVLTPGFGFVFAIMALVAAAVLAVRRP